VSRPAHDATQCRPWSSPSWRTFIARQSAWNRFRIVESPFSKLTRDYQRRAARARPRATIESTAAVRAAAASEFGGAAHVRMEHAGKALFLRTVASSYVMPSRAELGALWDAQDVNANGLLSLAEIDRVVCQRFPGFNNKPALLRAYKFADADGSGLISKREFCLLLRSLFFFNELWAKFERIDTSNDRRVDLGEFARGAALIGLDLTPGEARATFDEIDTNGGGAILFNEFCAYVCRMKAEELDAAENPQP